MNTAEQDDTLKIKPDLAIIVETQTSKWRIKPAAVDAVKRLASFAYGASSCSERSADADYIECSVAGGDRKIVGAVDGTLVVVGNSVKAVQSCLEVRRGVRPGIRTDPEFLKVRNAVNLKESLGFGYISSANSAKLFSWAAPVLIGRVPGDQQLEQLFAASAGKILRGVAWTSVSSHGAIEDRFLFSLEPGVVSRLQPAFEITGPDENFWKLVPNTFQSLTIYRSKEPATAWSSLDSAVALKLDALSSVLFSSLLKTGLSGYGISEPKEILQMLRPPLLTLKPSVASEGSVMLARVEDQPRLRRLLTQEVAKNGNGQILEGIESEPNTQKEFSVVFEDDYVLFGKTENMRMCLTPLRNRQVVAREAEHEWKGSSDDSSAAIVTYSNDEARLNNFISTLLMLQGRQLSSDEVAGLQTTIRNATFASTETSLSSAGIERKTRSAFGQFSTLVSLLQSNSSRVVTR
jgi:hypothetical protein